MHLIGRNATEEMDLQRKLHRRTSVVKDAICDWFILFAKRFVTDGTDNTTNTHAINLYTKASMYHIHNNRFAPCPQRCSFYLPPFLHCNKMCLVQRVPLRKRTVAGVQRLGMSAIDIRVKRGPFHVVHHFASLFCICLLVLPSISQFHPNHSRKSFLNLCSATPCDLYERHLI